MFEYMSQLSLSEQDNIKHVIQDLFRQTCILKVKYNPETLVAKDNPKYQVCNQHREFISDYLQVLGCELLHDSEEFIFRIAGDGVPTLRVSLTTTKLVLLLKLIYRDKIIGKGLHASVTNLKEIREYGKNTNLLPERLTSGEWYDALNLMKQHQMLEIPGAIKNLEDDTPLYIYSTVNLYCPTKEINALITQYQIEDKKEEEKNEEQESISTFVSD